MLFLSASIHKFDGIRSAMHPPRRVSRAVAVVWDDGRSDLRNPLEGVYRY